MEHNMITPERLSEIEKRCNAATAGPWGVEKTDIRNWIGPMRDDGHKISTIVTSTDRENLRMMALYRNDSNAQFIAAARTDIPDLLSEIKRLREDNKRMEFGIGEQSKIIQGLDKTTDLLRAQLSDAQAALTKAQIQHGSCSVCGFTAWQERDKNTQHCLYCDAQAALKVKDEALLHATIGACNCMTKTPDPEHHAASCDYKRYRLAMLNTAALQP
jgi:hypothetical protein